jgi:tetratricopeptide (TPR) repeat protein
MVQIERALALDPFNAVAQASYGNILLFDRRYEEAIVVYRNALTISPNMQVFAHTLATALEFAGRHEEALEAQGAYFSAVGDGESRQALARGYAEGGYAEAMRQAADAFARWSRRTDTASAYVSQLYARAGEKERALDWLERAFVMGDAGMPYLRMPGYDAVRGDPRFQDLMRRMNLPH